MRQADMNDLERLVFLEEEFFPDNNLNELSLRRELRASRCWVEDRGKEVVAYVIARCTREIVDILRIGVLQPFWGQGIATALIERVLEEAPEAMLTVRKDNARALQLYQHLGFQIVGEVTTGVAPGWMMLTSNGRRRCVRSGMQ